MNGNDTTHPQPEILKQLRESIDEIDERILQLVSERARVVQEVGKLKTQSAVDFYIPSREKAIYDRLLLKNPGPLPANAIRSVFRELISACRALETSLTISYLGPEGSYHHSAALDHFGSAAEFVAAATINDVVNEVERGNTDFGVVAIENSIEGIVGMTLDRLAHSDVRILGEIYLPISHNLISHSELSEIDKVYAHPQALAQCRRWLEANLPKAKLYEVNSNSLGVKKCAEERSAAAIAGLAAADQFEVPVKVRGIEDYVGNTTRFYIVGRRVNPPTDSDKTALIVFIRNQVGALYTMLEPFKHNQINLTNIVSRPTKREAWQYMFFLECETHSEDPTFLKAIGEIESHTLHVKVLGSFHKAKRPMEETGAEERPA